MTGGHPTDVDLLRLREAVEASWDARTSYQAARREGNPALGQCYPTARVVQFFIPEAEIARGIVETPDGVETHFWNALPEADGLRHLDFTWQQFPSGSTTVSFELLDRERLGDSAETIGRCDLLLRRVLAHLDRWGSCGERDAPKPTEPSSARRLREPHIRAV